MSEELSIFSTAVAASVSNKYIILVLPRISSEH